ncbi:hypothetical protein BO70DRAFT_295299 [Aspergillus heteromorphus CBS 117.55]|uniref:Prenylated rab acceptor 1 n=1 Tax=Aspergillus heteromorphus CBS 117.55 TaxID=1448321 RepID=A0A317VW82_9EURO|nr:uncharacterized protein BO70DRAFT_295299 [Aspergillus heteromorphus CBS 117.55]PWY76190.1 hypothetical protein BO70DRAFT_295299 [Aspergillus heteromorphus CBS 117.55]
MPQWGRPPGARVGRQTRRRAVPWEDGAVRVEEIDSEEEDAYIRRDARSLYARQPTGMDGDRGPRLRRRMMEYDDYGDDAPMDGAEYDLYEDMDSTVAYAVQLAMKDKEEQLVDQALDRIRRAQVQGQKNVRLSKPELDALERKRMQASSASDTEYKTSTPQGSPGGNRRLRPPESPNKKSGAQRSGSSSSSSKHGVPSQLTDNNAAYAFWARTSGASLGTSASPRSPLASARTQSNQTPPRSPLQPAYSPERFSSVPLVRTPGAVKKPAFARPLPDDPQWVPPYPLPYPREQPPYPTDRQRGSPGRPVPMPYASNYRSVFDDYPPAGGRSPASTQGVPGTATEGSPSEDNADEGSSSGDSGDEGHVVEVVERRVPAGTPSRGGGGGGSRQRSSRP